MEVKSFYDQGTGTFSYVVSDEQSKKCAVIDPVFNFDLSSGKTFDNSIGEIENYINQEKLMVEWILDTHVHADHLSGASKVKERLGGRIGIGSKITEVQCFWADFFNVNMPLDGSQFDCLFDDGDEFTIGAMTVSVLHTPGHTPACVCYLINDSIFPGDTVFLPHLGTARADFPGGSADTLYDSIQKILSMPDDYKIYVGHDYPKAGELPECQTTILEQKTNNIMINQSIDKALYVEKRKQRDSTLLAPKLLLPAIQVNIQAGKLPRNSAGQEFLVIPLNKL